MTKKLEEYFDLPPIGMEEDENDPFTNTITEAEESLPQSTDKIDDALPAVRDLMRSIDKYDRFETEGMRAFRKILMVAESVEDKYAAEMFQAAAKMMDTALKATNAEEKKKLQMIELQLKKARLDLDARIAGEHNTGGTDDRDEVFGNRNKIIAATIKEVGNSRDDDK